MATAKNQAATSGAPATPRPAAGPERSYHIVNPRGAIHSVTREHAAERLKSAGWRMATAEEIARLQAAGGLQTADSPICPPWSPDPDAQLELDGAAE